VLTQSQRTELAARLRPGDQAAGPIARRDPARQPPASFAQEQLWFIDQFAPGQASYNIPCVIGIRGRLDAAALSRALGALIERHETLRTRLVPSTDGPVQVIDEPTKPELRTIVLPRSELSDYIRTAAMRPFDLAAEPLLRTSLVRLSATDHLLVTVLHHAVFDGWSNGVFLRDLAALYGGEVTGQPAVLPELPVQFADFAVWERDRLNGSRLAGLQDYWQQTMAGFETIQFPTDRPHPMIEDFAGGLAERTTDATLLAELRGLSARENTTIFVTFMASMLTLLHRYTGQTDLVVGTVSANRGRTELAPMIAFLVNTLPVRTDLSGDPTFTELLVRVKQATVGAFAHQELPFSKIVDTLRIPRDAGRPPVFQISLGYAEQEAAAVTVAGVEFAVSDLIAGLPAAKFDLTFAAEARHDGLWLECSYKTALFDAATIERLLAHLETLLHGIVAKPTARLSELPMLTAAELQAELTSWNDTAGPGPRGCAHELFEAQAATNPDAVAARYEHLQISYAELNQQANQVARWLRELGVGPESLVGVSMRTSLCTLAVLLGIWKAGGGYVPLDPDMPSERLGFMIEDADINVIVTDTDAPIPALSAFPAFPALSALPALSAKTIMVNGSLTTKESGQRPIHHDHREAGAGDHREAGAGEHGEAGAGEHGEAGAGEHGEAGAGEHGEGGAGETGVTAANVAYVIYTSGSTGQPKGVVIEHRNLVNSLNSMNMHWPSGPGSVVLGFASIFFDASVQDLFLPLTGGGTVVLAPPDTLHSPARLAALLREARITCACLPPAVLNLLPDGDYPDLRILMVGGEELPTALARRWIRPGLRLFNVYGPTETTVNATQAELDASTPMPPPIGLPVRPNYRAYVLDQHLNPVPVGVTGELNIGGASVARGYLNRPELTAERFITSPWGERLYKTGDLVKRRPDGSIAYLGRIDNQVKIRGIRIELGEVEAALLTHPEVAQAVVVAANGELAAYVRLTSPIDEDDIRAYLARTLPAAMIPAYLIIVDTFPLTANGKIDKRALPAPSRRRATGHEAPATTTEEKLTGLYATLLGTQRAGATDGFFELGGNSLSAMRLVDMIGRATGVDIGVTQVFLHPTPRSLARVIDTLRDSGQTDERGPVVPLTPATAGPPLFLVHAIGGTVAAYAPLSRELADTFTVYGIESPGLRKGTLTDLVADYTHRIRAVQPDGPYRLGGWSMGGVIAFEIARRLERAGAEVGLLVLLDAPFDLGGSQGTEEQFVVDAVQTLGLEAPEVPATLDWLAARLSVDGKLLRRRSDVFAAHSRMIAGYQPAGPPVRGPALIVSALGSPNAPTRERWPSFLTRVRVECVDSDHYTFLRPPLVAEIGAMLREGGGE
jgi:amino acid adenylation domain-containing protein